MITLNEETHIYTHQSGSIVPSVTNILDALGTKPWYPDDDWYKRRGKQIHKATELHDRRTLGTCGDLVKKYIYHYQQFLEDTQVSFTGIEEIVFCESYWYCGKFDRSGFFPDGSPFIMDIKTFSTCKRNPPPSCGLQLAAYDHAKPAANKSAKRFALLLGEDGYRMKQYNDPTDKATWLAGVTFYQWLMRTA